MYSQNQYIECRKRNEQQLLKIRSLESEITNVKQQLKQKYEATSALRNKNEEFKRLTLQQTQFQSRLSATQDKVSLSAPLTKPLPIGAKRDLTQILTVTPKKIHEKLEDLLQAQYADGQAISSEKRSVIKQLISRLSDLYKDPALYELSESLLHSLQGLIAESQVHHNTGYQGIDKKKERYIDEYNSHRQDKIKALRKTLEELQEEYVELEKALVQRIKELHSDEAVQSLVIKSIRLKAVALKIKTELRHMKTQPSNLLDQIQKIKSQDILETERDRSKAKDILKAKVKVSSLLHVNNKCREELKDQRMKLNKGNEKEMVLCVEKINAAKLKIKSTNKMIREIDNTSKELLEAKNAMSPYTLISTIQLIKKIMVSIQSINYLEKNHIVEVCSDIRETLEFLLKKWSSSINKEDVPVLMEVSDNQHDGIDNVIQSIHALQSHFQEKENSYLQKQKHNLESLLHSTDTIENEITHTEKALEERQLISKIGESFTVKDKQFSKWLEELEQ